MRRRTRFLSHRALPVLAAALPALTIALLPAPAAAQISIGINLGGPAVDVGIRIGYAPPPMPVYAPPPLPEPDYLWVPGHWAWSDWIDDYYWVNGYWQRPPEPGLLWTPAWWGWDNGAFGFHEGYWGHEVGWYGGIDYGNGYGGHGWDGGHWENGHLAYNGAVVNVTNIHVTNVYYQPVPVHSGPRVSYNGGAGGVAARPTPQEIRATQAPHIPPTAEQQRHVQQAASNPHAAASQLTPGWHPPAVHRVAANGAPISREAALAKGGATAGAPPGFHPGAPVGPAPGHGANPAGAPPRAGEPRLNTVPPRAESTPPREATEPRAPSEARTAPEAHTAPAPSAYHAPAPSENHAPAPHPAPAPAPRAAPPPPRPAPPPPKPHPAPPPKEKPEEHHEHP